METGFTVHEINFSFSVVDLSMDCFLVVVVDHSFLGSTIFMVDI